ncbi:MAG: hypothetical protein M3Z00_12130 [Actinomycetota bacterium]|nr:hypothetical protein [Actinomycetota bacterium]
MESPDQRPLHIAVTRRAVLAAAGTVAVLASCGCTAFTSTKTTRTVVAIAPPPIDPMDTLIAMTRLHLLRLVAGIQLGGDAAKKLPALRDDRIAHLQRLLQEQARVNRSAEAPLTQAGQTVPAAGSAAAAIAGAAQDAADAQLAFSDQLANVSKYRAALFASISACLSTHRVVLS